MERSLSLYRKQLIGRIRLAVERRPTVWVWSITIHDPARVANGTALDLEAAKRDFRRAWFAE